ncbi:hypothetical protein FDA33_10515 [Clostridium botulinum]|uniref:Uncharacterized protein n=1 Tax=Clostridium botulinum TaxID=1491 RepID=A0A0M1LD33_CLOBO|nr:hypothetical protein [Clostridium botulinum]KOR55614.1 hypothetical protein ADT22_15370 [Clostridium botulinum]MCS6112692.1 hypothetical protein [Clostridium botulinum]NFF89393.1 hypothetical protein [Clostridium botulinum]NFG11546.1 hypothetical protein [Clostridium botulinum]NFH90624.1 hypothetical protein [Clostridium botulinum]
MRDNILMIISGIIFLIGGICLKFGNKYFVNNVLPKESLKEQEKYYKNEQKLSEMGAFNVPFKDGKLISKGNSRQDFYSFIVGLGVFAIIFGLAITIKKI